MAKYDSVSIRGQQGDLKPEPNEALLTRAPLIKGAQITRVGGDDWFVNDTNGPKNAHAGEREIWETYTPDFYVRAVTINDSSQNSVTTAALCVDTPESNRLLVRLQTGVEQRINVTKVFLEHTTSTDFILWK